MILESKNLNGYPIDNIYFRFLDLDRDRERERFPPRRRRLPPPVTAGMS